VPITDALNPMAGLRPELRNLSVHRTKHKKRHDQQVTLCCVWPLARFPASTPATLALGIQSIRHSKDFRAVPTGSAILVVRIVGRWISCFRMTTAQLICGILPSGKAILERRYSPRCLCVNDNDLKVVRGCKVQDDASR